MQYEKRGYLEEDYKIFSLKDEISVEFNYHYHDFYKIILFLKGDVAYTIEGKCYPLEPYDIVLVNRGEIHRVEVGENAIYERIIIYISKNYLDRLNDSENGLGQFFDLNDQEDKHVLRLRNKYCNRLFSIAMELKDEDTLYAHLYHEALMMQLFILLNRALKNHSIDFLESLTKNQKISEILLYIKEHLLEELTVDRIASTFFISRYHLMHIFKEETGYTLVNYIIQKRLILSREYIEKGSSITEACYLAGFREHSTYLRAFRKIYGETPNEYRKKIFDISSE